MTTRRDSDNENIKKHKEIIRSFFDELPKKICEEMIKFEENKVQCIFLANIVTDNNLHSYIEFRHIDYASTKEIYQNQYFDKYDGQFNIKKIIEAQNVEMPPFVYCKINKRIYNRYIGDDVDILNAFSNINVDDLYQHHKFKLYKTFDENNFYLLLFIDSLNYNDNFIFTDQTVGDLGNYRIHKNNVGNNLHQELFQKKMKNNVVVTPPIEYINHKILVDLSETTNTLINNTTNLPKEEDMRAILKEEFFNLKNRN
jgi:hypothetical protein